MKHIISATLLLALTACAASETAEPDTHEETPDQPTEQTPETPEPDPELPMDPPEMEPEEPETLFEECATQFDAAQLAPLDMVLMVDRSGSMLDDGKWGSVATAIQQFAANPDSQGIGVSLSYFPEAYSSVCYSCDYYCDVCFNGCCALPTGEFCWDDGDCDGGGVCFDFMCHAGGGNATCEVGDYAQPDMPLATLPGAAGQINISLSTVDPVGGTPTGPALEGALAYAQTLTSSTTANPVVVVLATDGEPTECQPQSIGDVASIAAAGVALPTPIPTFVIGVGANMFNLNVIASAGGTQQAHLVDTNVNATQSFLEALNEIREVAVACQYQIPSVNGNIAYDKVNVAYTAEGQALTAVPHVPSAAACGINGGWHYDNPNAPQSIVMCPSTCEMLQGADETKLEIVYGCETIID